MSRQTVTPGCPDCGGHSISGHPSKPGFHQCSDCANLLVKVNRRGNTVLGGGSVAYVNPGRSGPQVEGPPRSTDSQGVIDVE